jgi:hypothetical protein
MSNSLHEAILDGFKKAGWLSPSEDVVRQIEYSVNQMDGRAGNEGEKTQRRKEAVATVAENYGMDKSAQAWLDAIIAEAQG